MLAYRGNIVGDRRWFFVPVAHAKPAAQVQVADGNTAGGEIVD